MSLVRTLVKRGKFNKWFSRKAAQTTTEVYQSSFGNGVSRRAVRILAISHVFWIEDSGKTAAAMMLGMKDAVPVYRIEGLAVDPEYRRQGYATSLLESVDRFVGPGATVWLCVDKGQPSTEWLVHWYRRMGFELAYRDDRLPHRNDEIPMRKLIK